MDEHIDETITQINPKDVDVVVGISTGGAFVGAYIAKRLGKPFEVITSKLWSGLGFIANAS
jgi:adenine/guanine phosphoribosyltransferase-like PRPP-binding protein